MLFPLGQVAATPSAILALHTIGVDGTDLLRRHASGDWGDMDDHDKSKNDDAIRWGARIFSAYTIAEDVTVWIITEADRSVTTLLLPGDY